MKLFLFIVFVIGMGLVGLGLMETNGKGSADERVGGSFLIIAGGAFLVLGFAVTLVWLVWQA